MFACPTISSSCWFCCPDIFPASQTGSFCTPRFWCKNVQKKFNKPAPRQNSSIWISLKQWKIPFPNPQCMVYLFKFRGRCRYIHQPHWASVFIIKPAFLGWSRHHLPGKPTSPSNVILRGLSTHISPPISSQGGLPMNVMIGVETLINGLQNWGFPGVKGRRYNKPYFQLGRVPVAYLVLSAWWRLLFIF